MQVFESPFDDGMGAEFEDQAHRSLEASRDRMAAGWNPELIRSWSERRPTTATLPGTPSGESLDMPHPYEDMGTDEGYELRVSVTLGRITLPPVSARKI